jgi:predicted HD phosphohydrolase
MSFDTVEDVLDLFRLKGDRGYGEDVTSLEHALQCAALAEAAGADDSLIAAALLHDVRPPRCRRPRHRAFRSRHRR